MNIELFIQVGLLFVAVIAVVISIIQLRSHNNKALVSLKIFNNKNLIQVVRYRPYHPAVY